MIMKIYIWYGVLFMLIVAASSYTHRENADEHMSAFAQVSKEKRSVNHHYNAQGRPRKEFAEKALAARKRRNMVGEHGLRAEADSLAAAAESVAAGENAVAAVEEIEEERHTDDHGYQNNEGGGYFNEGGGGAHEGGGGTIEGSGSANEGGGDTNEDSYNGNDVNQEYGEAETAVVEENSFHEKTKKSHTHKAESKPDSQDENSSETVDSSNESSASQSTKGEGGAALNNLMSQSSDLAKQIRTIFEVMSKRESYLVEEMKKLQSALSNAISVLKSGESDGSNSKRKRREFSEEPYRACVYIEAAEDYGGGHKHHRKKRSAVGNEQTEVSENGIEFHPEAIAHTNDGGRNDYEETNSRHFESNHTANYRGNEGITMNNEGIDLRSVYWMKLPSEQFMEKEHEKIRLIFSLISASGKDVLIIPVSKGFSSSKAITQEFFNAFRAKRAARWVNRSKRRLSITQL